jgi:hypothetical protein
MTCKCCCGESKDDERGLKEAREIAGRPLNRDTILDLLDREAAKEREEEYIKAGMPR